MSTAVEKEAGKVLETFDIHMETVAPGQPAQFTEACVAGDTIWQGDLGITMVDAVPKGYQTKCPVENHDTKQLVPGNTTGARHCFNTMEGVELHYPEDWGKEECLDGPTAVVSGGQVIEHPKHGNVTLVKGVFKFSYQREFDAEQKRERRARD